MVEGVEGGGGQEGCLLRAGGATPLCVGKASHQELHDCQCGLCSALRPLPVGEHPDIPLLGLTTDTWGVVLPAPEGRARARCQEQWRRCSASNNGALVFLIPDTLRPYTPDP